MPLPDMNDIYIPILEALRDQAPHNLAINDLIDTAAKYFGLDEISTIDRKIFKQRITDAKNELKLKGYMTNPADNMYIITSAGLGYLDNPGDDDMIVQEDEHDEPELEATEESEVTEEHEEIPEIIEPEISNEEEDIIIEDDPEIESLPEIETETEPAVEPEIESLPEVEPEIEPAVEPEIESVQEVEPETELTAEPEIESLPEIEPETEPADEPEIESAPEIEPETEPEPENINEDTNMNPSTGIDEAIRVHNEELSEEILAKMSELPTEMFDVFVIDLLSKMGYRAFHNARYTSEETGSLLIHGVIIDDKTGAPIYIHARKSSVNKTIGRADMQDFIDALSDKGGKGIFATTASFSEQAEILANDERIMLIDGMKLAGLMIAHNFCVKVEKVYEIKGLDAENFNEYKK